MIKDLCMRERIRDLDRLKHILDCIENVMNYLEGKSFQQMNADRMCFHAVVYNIMVIGEAANMLTKDFREEHPEVPWRDIIDMRNVLIHGYYVASPLFVWETYTDNLPEFKLQIERFIAEMSHMS